jgi:hypothetical protein
MSKRKDTLLTLDKFNGGSNSLVDEARMDPKFAVQSLNLIQVQDSIWKTRWGFNYYGVAIDGESSIDGATEYIKSDGTRELIAIGGTTGGIFKSTDNGASWSQIGATTLTAGKTPFFLQIRSYLYIANGEDLLCYYDGSDIQTYSAINPPAWGGTPLTRGAGLSAGSYTLYYQVTALNSVGETVGNEEQSITVDKKRDSWDTTADDEYVDLDWDAVEGATRYNVYFSDETGHEIFLASVVETAYRDDGSSQPNEYIEIPDDNTTAAPKFTHMESSGNRMWATGDPDNPFRVYASGVGQYLGYFSPFYGGMWVDLEKGGRERPQAVTHYRTGKGDPIATVLCSSPEGSGSIWQIEMTAITVSDVTFSVPITYKIVGSIGTDAPLSVVKARDNIGFGNKKGFFFLRNKEQLFNVLSTDEASQMIRPNWRSLNGSVISKMCAYYYDGKVFISVPEGSSNDLICIIDLERNNWNWKWTRGVKRFFEYTDDGGKSHFLAIPTTGGRLWEISENYTGSDFGGAFYQGYISPLIPVSKDKTGVLKTKHAIVELGRPRGSLTYEVLGIEAKKGFSSLGSKTISDSVSNMGFSWDRFSTIRFSTTSGTPSTYTQATVKKALKLRKRVYAIQHKVYSTSTNTDFSLLSFQVKGRLLPKKVPSTWGD